MPPSPTHHTPPPAHRQRPAPRPSTRGVLLCLLFYLAGRLPPPRAVPGCRSRDDQVVAEVLFGTPLARTHLRTFLPRADVPALNAALAAAILADHAAFLASRPNASDSALANDAFFELQARGVPSSLAALRHRQLRPFGAVANAAAATAARLLPRGKERRMQAWATVHGKGSRHERHDHAGVAVAVVYYVRVGPRGGVLRLHDPRGGGGVVEVKPREGEIVAFPGWLEHEVVAGEGTRVSVAFNVLGEWGEAEEVDVGRIGLGRFGARLRGWRLDGGGTLDGRVRIGVEGLR